MAAKPWHLKPEFPLVAVWLFALHALVKAHLVAHPAANLVDPKVVAVAEEVVVRHQPLDGTPNDVDVVHFAPAARGRQLFRVEVGKVAVEQRRKLGPPRTDVSSERHLIVKVHRVRRRAAANVDKHDVEVVVLEELVGQMHERG